MISHNNATRNQQIIQFYQQHIPVSAIADLFGISSAQVYNILKAAGATRQRCFIDGPQRDATAVLRLLSSEGIPTLASKLKMSQSGLYARRRAAEAQLYRRMK